MRRCWRGALLPSERELDCPTLRTGRRALEHDLPESVAWAAYTFVTERLPSKPHRLGGELASPYEACRSAHLGTYRVVYRIDEDTRTVYVLSIRLRGDVYGTR